MRAKRLLFVVQVPSTGHYDHIKTAQGELFLKLLKPLIAKRTYFFNQPVPSQNYHKPFHRLILIIFKLLVVILEKKYFGYLNLVFSMKIRKIQSLGTFAKHLILSKKKNR